MLLKAILVITGITLAYGKFHYMLLPKGQLQIIWILTNQNS